MPQSGVLVSTIRCAQRGTKRQMVGDLELPRNLPQQLPSGVGVMATCDDISQHLLILKSPRLPTISNGRQDENLEGSSWKIGQPNSLLSHSV